MKKWSKRVLAIGAVVLIMEILSWVKDVESPWVYIYHEIVGRKSIYPDDHPVHAFVKEMFATPDKSCLIANDDSAHIVFRGYVTERLWIKSTPYSAGVPFEAVAREWEEGWRQRIKKITKPLESEWKECVSTYILQR